MAPVQQTIPESSRVRYDHAIFINFPNENILQVVTIDNGIQYLNDNFVKQNNTKIIEYEDHNFSLNNKADIIRLARFTDFIKKNLYFKLEIGENYCVITDIFFDGVLHYDLEDVLQYLKDRCEDELKNRIITGVEYYYLNNEILD